MVVESLSQSCWSDHYLLKLDGRPWGEYRSRWFSEGMDVNLTGRRQLRLEKSGWMGSRFQLIDTSSAQRLAEAEQTGIFGVGWELRLGGRAARLVRPGWFSSDLAAMQGDRVVAKIHRVGWCQSGWSISDDGSLQDTDLLFIGLIYHTILRREAAAAST
ncbi:MAG: hypothetical protein U0795_14955 [Pirellulales bacterium]